MLSDPGRKVVFFHKVLVKCAAFFGESTKRTVATYLIFNPVLVRENCLVLLHYVIRQSTFAALPDSTGVA